MADTTGKEHPETRLGWTRLAILVSVAGPFVYWRLSHTALGRTLVAFVDPETERRG